MNNLRYQNKLVRFGEHCMSLNLQTMHDFGGHGQTLALALPSIPHLPWVRSYVCNVFYEIYPRSH